MILNNFTRTQILLKGTLEEDDGKRVARIRVEVLGAGDDWTDNNGQFQINVSNDFVEGEQVLIKSI